MASIITTEELKKKIDSGAGNFYLIDVLSPQSYGARHVPGAKNIPEKTNFLKTFEKVTQAPKDAEIVVYCSSDTCMASVRAAYALEKARYTNVKHYKDGLAGWKDAGYALVEGN